MDIIAEGATAVEAVDAVLALAADRGATDIHIDPGAESASVRLRIDGLLRAAGSLPIGGHAERIARLKILSGARTDVHAVPQDGRWRAEVSGAPYNIRISFMPTYHGENAVLRLLPARDDGSTPLEALGFSPAHARLIRAALGRASGLVLIAGPTGSGKTTTLRSCLSEKAVEPISVMTLEDPVEYEIPGVRQVHVRREHGVTFAAGLRAALRQDPDVIMVGEIRDSETARVAVHTALTGHLVLSTIHTNSALEAVPRLMDMGVDPYLLASTLSLVVAQRLIRTVCPSCLGEGAESGYEVDDPESGAVFERLHEYAGCAECRSTGWRGRTVIAEALPIGPSLRSCIDRRAPIDACLAEALAAGFVDLASHGAEKAACGMTTSLEVRRVLAI